MTKYAAIRKSINTLDNIVNLIIRIVMICIMLIGLYMTLDTIGVYYLADAGRVSAYKPELITEETLGMISEDAIGWIEIEDTKIDYPVMQGEDNSEYLNKDAYGEYSLAGAIFLDYRNAKGFTDPYSIIYGHHMNAGYMFGALDAYEDKNYFDEHRKGKLTAGSAEHDFTVAAFLTCDTSDEEIFELDNNGHAAFIREHAIYIDDTINLDEKTLVALTTCKSPGSTERTILIGIIEGAGA